MKWPVRIRKVLPEVTDRLKIEVECKDLIEIWPEIVGVQVAKHARPHRVEAGILYLQVDSPAWHHHLFMLKSEILRTIGKRLPGTKIREIRMITEDE